jgi:curli biogenesis system outer membrane secretion channel CsgG
MFRSILLVLVLATAGASSAQVTSGISPSTMPESLTHPQNAGLKHKLAVGRFTNETMYGQTFFRTQDLDPLGKQAADILMAYLAKTGRFLVLERTDLTKVTAEQAVAGTGQQGLVGADALIIGSIVEFGRTEDGKRGFLNKEREQRAHAKVAVRLVDVRTGVVFHSATGQGEATTQTKTVLGIGSTASFDGTLTDKALSVAVEDMLDELVNTLSARPWRSDILAVEGGQVYIAGGARQGLKPGDRLKVMRAGRSVKSAQTGFDIPLPSTEVATLEVLSFFGDSETSEGSIARVVSGTLPPGDTGGLYVTAG